MTDEIIRDIGKDIDPETGNFIEDNVSKPEQIAAEAGFKNLTEAKNFIRALHDDYDIELADYDADFSGKIPFFINIWSKESGCGYGFNVFLHFLQRVGKENEFNSTDFTESGNALFQKAIKEGLIAQVSGPSGLQRLTRWKVIQDPREYRKEKLNVLLGLIKPLNNTEEIFPKLELRQEN